MRLSGALAALLGRAEGVEHPEDNLLGWLREAGQITYPAPLLGGLLERLPEVLAAEVLPRLPPTDLAMVARVGPASRAAVMSSGMLRAGENVGLPLKLEQFVGSVERLAWAKANDCPWVARVCTLAAAGGRVGVLRWAREQGCPWKEEEGEETDENFISCALAAWGGHLDVLKWLREHHCPWNEWTCAFAAKGGRLDVLKWAREHGCPWEENIADTGQDCCAHAAVGGHLAVLQWAREHGCMWDAWTTASAAEGGHLEVLKWAREHHCPWHAHTRHYAEQHGHLELLQWAVEHGAP